MLVFRTAELLFKIFPGANFIVISEQDTEELVSKQNAAMFALAEKENLTLGTHTVP